MKVKRSHIHEEYKNLETTAVLLLLAQVDDEKMKFPVKITKWIIL